MFSQNPTEQKAQMEALANNIDALIDLNQAETYRSTTLPTQGALEAWWLSLGNTLPIPPQRDIYWHDTRILRSLHSTMKDFYAPVMAQPAYLNTLGSDKDVRCVFLEPIDAQHSVYSGTTQPITGTSSVQPVKTVKLYMDGTASLIGTFTALDYDPINREIIYASSNNLRRIHIDTLVDTSLVAPVSASGLYVAHQRPDKVVYYCDFDGILRQRDAGGSITTIVTLNTILTGTVYAIRYDVLTDKILLFYYNSVNGHTGVMRINATGAITATAMVALSAYGAGIAALHSIPIGGGLEYFYSHGFEVRDGILYVPEVGLSALNVNTRRRIDIATNTVLGTETFDFGEAKSVLDTAVQEATALRDLDDVEVTEGIFFGSTPSTGNHRTQASRYYGVQHLSGLFTKLIDIQRLPSDDGWYIRNWTSWGPGPLLLTSAGHTLGNYWSTGVLPDSTISGKIYAISEYGDLKSDYVTLKSVTADSAVKEMSVDWSDLDMDDFGTIEIEFDSGLSGADTVSVQVNGNTSAAYTQHLFRLNVSTNTYSTAASGTAWLLPSTTIISTMSGRYQILFPMQDLGNVLVGQVHGNTFTGTTTGLINAILGQLSHTLTAPLTSVKIFSTGGVQNFQVGSRLIVRAYRTRSRYNRSGAYYGPIVV